MGFLLMSDNGKAKPINWVRLELPTPGPSLEKNLGTTCECFKCNMLLAAEGHWRPCREIWGGLSKFYLNSQCRGCVVHGAYRIDFAFRVFVNYFKSVLPMEPHRFNRCRLTISLSRISMHCKGKPAI